MSALSRTPSFWTSDQDGTLLDPPNGDALGEIHGINEDGSILLGEWLPGDATTGGGKASKWTFNGTGYDREQIANGSILAGWTGIPLGLADNGTIVGFDILLTTRRAWILDQGKGNLVLLKAWANARGAKIPAAQDLQVSQAISADGTKICGHGFLTGAWIIEITPDVLLGDVNLDGTVNLLDVAPFVAVVTSGKFQAEADTNQDGVVNLLDVQSFVDIITG